MNSEEYRKSKILQQAEKIYHLSHTIQDMTNDIERKVAYLDLTERLCREEILCLADLFNKYSEELAHEYKYFSQELKELVITFTPIPDLEPTSKNNGVGGVIN